MSFFESNYLQYANSDNFQSISNCIDGLKPTQRKLLHTYYNLTKKETLKVSQLANKMAEFTEYLSGEDSASGVLVNMSKSFKGSNNISYFETKGHFGDRFYPKSNSAPRYIFVKSYDLIEKIFRKEDYPILIEQEFEGKKIEPRFFVPIIPMILANGSEGIGNGYAQKILPRNEKNLIEFIKKDLKEDIIDEKLLSVHFKNYKGEIKQEENKIEILPKIELEETKRGYNFIKITDIPFNFDLPKILKTFNNLEDNSKIISYEDKSENEEFYFLIKTKMDIETFLKESKLSQKITENYTSIDEDNKIKEYENVIDLYKDYKKIRLDYYKKRKDYILEKLKKEKDFILDKIKFINGILEDKIIINKRSEKDILNDCKNLEIKFPEKHLRMNILSFSKEKIEELEKQKNNLIKEITDLEKMSLKDIWIKELEELEKLL